MSLSDFFRKPLDPTHRCRWCTQPIGMVDHGPIPVCNTCFQRAATHVSPVFVCAPCFDYRIRLRDFERLGTPCPHAPKDYPGSLWEKLMREFPVEARRWAKRLATRVSTNDVVLSSTEATMDVVQMQTEAYRLAKAGKPAEAAALREEAERKLKAVKDFKAEVTPLAIQLERED